ncbi:hypothetical protein BG015_002254 [Linnemannia schmuckeri]|uniref:HCP-like protein n=1 Tax=Linnemannia schmuckeri TaxID=64567 RepID=A0A9P5S349_9FUNG|nr:hypothetical protein BG015_002254 [Linnemannia schmuckeri]
MTVQEISPSLQAVRRVNESDNENDQSSSTESAIIHLAVHPDLTSGKDVILWDDIKATFDDVIHVRSGTVVQTFLKGSDFKILNPLRIAAVPEVTLDVVVRNKAELSLESLQTALPKGEVDENTSTTSDTAVTVSGRSPTYGLENVAMEASKNNDNPDAKPPSRGPHTLLDDISPTTSNGTPPTSQDAELKTQPPRAPQETASDAAKNVARTMMNARLGDNKALVALGDMYRDGLGVRQDYKAAMAQYKKASDQGYAEAQCNIGLLHHDGQGVTKDFHEAMRWYTKAANQGYARAQHFIGHLYHYGQGCKRSYYDATIYYVKAANQGFALSQCRMGYFHQKGWHVKQSHSLAMKWYLKASDQEHADAQYNVGYLYHQGFGVAQDHSQAMDWYLKAAKKGHAVAQTSAGVMYQHGQGVPQDDALALDWYRKAAAQGNANAQFNLGLTYEYGMGVPLNREKAVEWYQKAADRGDVDAKEKLEELKQQGDSA